MKHIDKSFIVVSGMLIALAGTAVPALAVTSINSCPANVTTAGDYQLTADLGCTITISASGVSLKLNGHTIAPPSGNDGIDVTGAGRLNHVGIQGPGLIKGIGSTVIGINIGNVDYSQVGLVTIKGFVAGIAVAAGNTQSATFLTIASNVIGQSSGIGIFLNNCTSCAVFGNDVSGSGGTSPSTDANPGVGIAVQGGGGGNTVNNNVSNGNVFAGIGIGGGTGNRVYGNTTNGNGAYGIGVGAPGTQVFSNTSQANGTADLIDQSATCSGTVWGNNVFQTSAFGSIATPTIPSPCIH